MSFATKSTRLYEPSIIECRSTVGFKLVEKEEPALYENYLPIIGAINRSATNGSAFFLLWPTKPLRCRKRLIQELNQ